MSVRHGVGISIIDRDNAAHISLTTPRTDFSFAGTPRWSFSRTSRASKGDRSPSFRWRLRICRGSPPRALRGLIFRTLGDGIDIFFWNLSGQSPARRWRGWIATQIRRKSAVYGFFLRGSSNSTKNAIPDAQKVAFRVQDTKRGAERAMRRLILFTLRVGEVIALKTVHVCGSLFAN